MANTTIDLAHECARLSDAYEQQRKLFAAAAQQLARIADERDGYGDALAAIRDRSTDPDFKPAQHAAAVLGLGGYVPWDRLRQAEAALDDARDEIASLKDDIAKLTGAYPAVGSTVSVEAVAS